MGLHFGELAFIRGIVYYRLMPQECRPFAKMMSEGLPNIFTRFRSSFLTWLPTFAASYFIMRYVDYTNWQKHRKNPKDYINEVDPNVPAAEVVEEAKKERCPKKENKKK